MHYPNAICSEHSQAHVNSPAFTPVNVAPFPWQCPTLDRWQRRRAHIVFALEAIDALSSETQKDKHTHTHTHTHTTARPQKQTLFHFLQSTC